MPKHHFRASDTLWAKLLKISREDGFSSGSDCIRYLIQEYVKQYEQEKKAAKK